MDTTTVPYQSRDYSVSISQDTTWEDALSSIVIKNSKKQFVYKKHDDGNRVAILVNALYLQGLTKYIMHNGYQYIYVKSMDVLISRSSKKLVFTQKANCQRRDIIASIK